VLKILNFLDCNLPFCFILDSSLKVILKPLFYISMKKSSKMMMAFDLLIFKWNVSRNNNDIYIYIYIYIYDNETLYHAHVFYYPISFFFFTVFNVNKMIKLQDLRFEYFKM
jgi:hypothetical protein